MRDPRTNRVLPVDARGLYLIGWCLCYPFARLLFRLRVVGRERVPLTGSVIIAANHESYLDIPFVGLAVPRRASYMGKRELFDGGLSGWLFSKLGGFPIDRGRAARNGLAEGVRRLQNGEAVVMYPEGARARDGRLARGLPGLGLMVRESGAPVIPTYVHGAGRALPPGRIIPRLVPVTVIFGEPIDFNNENVISGEGDRLQATSDAVMGKIQALKASLEKEEGVEAPAGNL